MEVCYSMTSIDGMAIEAIPSITAGGGCATLPAPTRYEIGFQGDSYLHARQWYTPPGGMLMATKSKETCLKIFL